ncbi:hypothetical protein ACLOJK_024179 [Asimina triloba]
MADQCVALLPKWICYYGRCLAGQFGDLPVMVGFWEDLAAIAARRSCDRMGFANGGGDGFKLPILAVMADYDGAPSDLEKTPPVSLPAVAGRSLPAESG